MDNARQMIRDMAKLSLMTNRINEIQEKNLKIYAFAFFEGVREAKIDYDFSSVPLIETEEDKKKLLEEKDEDAALALKYKMGKVDTKHFRVSYYLKVDEKAPQLRLDKRFNTIEQAVRTLFWNEVKVEVFFNDIKVYESKDGKQNANP